jgi:hypothetical protein
MNGWNALDTLQSGTDRRQRSESGDAVAARWYQYTNRGLGTDYIGSEREEAREQKQETQITRPKSTKGRENGQKKDSPPWED